MEKDLYQGMFNLSGEVHTIYRHAPKGKEWIVLTRGLAKKLERTHYSIRQYFSEGKNNHSIKRMS